MAKSINLFLAGVLLGIILTGSIFAYIYFGQSGQYDRELGEYRTRVAELEQQYSDLRARASELDELIERRKELDRRAIEEAQGIATRIRELSLQGANITEQLRRTIGTLKEIQGRIKVLEELVNRAGNLSSP